MIIILSFWDLEMHFTVIPWLHSAFENPLRNTIIILKYYIVCSINIIFLLCYMQLPSDLFQASLVIYGDNVDDLWHRACFQFPNLNICALLLTDTPYESLETY